VSKQDANKKKMQERKEERNGKDVNPNVDRNKLLSLERKI